MPRSRQPTKRRKTMSEAATAARNETRITSAMLDDVMNTEAGRREIDTEMHKRGYTKPQGLVGNVFHGIEHIATPGIGNIVQGLIHIAGTYTVIRGVYALGRWGYRKATGSEAGAALP